ncbi:hypothetical protein S-PM2d156 [Synechococcus phage S-PM2]|uniref:Hypothetical-Protein / belonging to T4-LIKE GC: 849 n=1 Tax=Synechococcus phage S-PM2 TaxID=238854 RepID=Q5GQI1_BPSYP|nr:Hypothetical-Protein / belonging to T4-LIKE GC: 849 [Synechococcus phage S-PM2]CAF34221.1 Hypothetical-Protein / belonging to T4-LIKE GC: 849 [Synechococcus phage S-PM2]CFW42350.1 hypothetical protein S-PM2d156 [Synechococcus phage S-PM2]
MKSTFLLGLLVMRLITNEGVFNEGRRPQPKRQPTEVTRFIRRPAKRGRKKARFIIE